MYLCKKEINHMKKPKQSYVGWYVMTGVIILFALFAPIIFTRPGMIDFTETGQIGDTIAGTMGPFIAIAGVVVTFLAFLMQKKANDLLSSQYEADKIAEKEKDSELFKTRIKLMLSDITMARNDIGSRIAKIEEFKQKLSDNPFRTFRLERAPSDLYRRMSESDREDLLLALLGTSVQNPTLALNKYYSISDYMSSAVDLINNMCDGLTNEIHDKLTIIGESITAIQSMAMSYGWLGHNKKECVQRFVQLLRDNNKTGEGGESDFMSYWKAIDNLRVSLNIEISNPEDEESAPLIDRAISLCERALEQYQRINNAATQMINTLERSKSDLQTIANTCEETQKLITNQE